MYWLMVVLNTSAYTCINVYQFLYVCVHELGKGLCTVGGLDYWTDRFSFKTHI